MDVGTIGILSWVCGIDMLKTYMFCNFYTVLLVFHGLASGKLKYHNHVGVKNGNTSFFGLKVMSMKLSEKCIFIMGVGR